MVPSTRKHYQMRMKRFGPLDLSNGPNHLFIK